MLGMKVDKSECVMWEGATSRGGYPVVFRKGKTQLYHRWRWRQLHGPIPKKMCVCHRCDTPGCVNPDHWFLGTHQENMIDKMLKGHIKVAKGEDAGNAKLTEAKVTEIRVLYKTGRYSMREIGKLYDVNCTTVHKIVKRITWKHLK